MKTQALMFLIHIAITLVIPQDLKKKDWWYRYGLNKDPYLPDRFMIGGLFALAWSCAVMYPLGLPETIISCETLAIFVGAVIHYIMDLLLFEKKVIGYTMAQLVDIFILEMFYAIFS